MPNLRFLFYCFRLRVASGLNAFCSASLMLELHIDLFLETGFMYPRLASHSLCKGPLISNSLAFSFQVLEHRYLLQCLVYVVLGWNLYTLGKHYTGRATAPTCFNVLKEAFLHCVRTGWKGKVREGNQASARRNWVRYVSLA